MKTGKFWPWRLCRSWGGLSLQAQEKTYKLSDFSQVDVQTKIKARLVASNESRVVVEGSQIDNIVVKQENDRVVIRVKSTKAIGSDPVPATVYYAAPLTYLGASGESEILAQDVLKGGNIRIDASKGAFVQANVTADTLRASIAAGGQIQSGGDVTLVDVSIKTGGQFNGYELVADHAEATITAGGTAYLCHPDDQSAGWHGGKVYCKGPAKVDGRTTMGGTVIAAEEYVWGICFAWASASAAGSPLPHWRLPALEEKGE